MNDTPESPNKRFGGMTSEGYLERFLNDRTITRGQWYRAWQMYRKLSRYC